MTTSAQIAANHKNAQLSNGEGLPSRPYLSADKHGLETRSWSPATDAGKAVSSQDGTLQGLESRPYLSGQKPGLEKHPCSGLSSAFRVLIHESQSEFDALKRALETEFHPESEHESFLTSQMVQSRWLAILIRTEA